MLEHFCRRIPYVGVCTWTLGGRWAAARRGWKTQTLLILRGKEGPGRYTVVSRGSRWPTGRGCTCTVQAMYRTLVTVGEIDKRSDPVDGRLAMMSLAGAMRLPRRAVVSAAASRLFRSLPPLAHAGKSVLARGDGSAFPLFTHAGERERETVLHSFSPAPGPQARQAQNLARASKTGVPWENMAIPSLCHPVGHISMLGLARRGYICSKRPRRRHVLACTMCKCAAYRVMLTMSAARRGMEAGR